MSLQCVECYKYFGHRPIDFRNKPFCSKECRDHYKGLPKGDMKNKGSRATPCGMRFPGSSS